MKENTKNQIEEMKKQTIGVEIEMADITREKAIRTVAEYFNTLDTVEYIGGAYRAWSCKDNKGRTWTVTRFRSMRWRTRHTVNRLACSGSTADTTKSLSFRACPLQDSLNKTRNRTKRITSRVNSKGHLKESSGTRNAISTS